MFLVVSAMVAEAMGIGWAGSPDNCVSDFSEIGAKLLLCYSGGMDS